jgi:hypothetical protein
MQITVNSSDSLQDVLRVVGSLYGVELTVAPNEGQPAEPAAQNGTGTRRRAAARGAGEPRGRRSRRASGEAEKTDLAAVRAWAREHGHQVSDRGRVPNAVLEAYKESAQAG